MRTILLLAALSPCPSAFPQQWLDVTPVPMPGATTADPAHGRMVTLPDQPAKVFEWDGGAWSEAVSFPPGRSGPVIGYDATARKVVCVFATPAGLETWLLDDRTWTNVNVPTPVVYRLVADPVNGGLLGVANGSPTWQLSWNGVQWQTLPAAPGPDLMTCGLVADTQRGCVLAFGGYSSFALTNDTWQWNGNNWQLLQPPHRPSPRVAPGMALDLTTGNVVLHGGGQLQVVTPLRDTWIWNGSDWLATATTLMPDVAPGSQRIEFDRTRNAVVLFGTDVGGDARGYQWTGTDWVILPDCETPALVAVTEDLGRRRIVGITPLGVREHDGYRWLRPASIGGPTNRIRCPLAYFPGGAHTLLFGGDAWPRGDTWTWDGTAWTTHWTGPQPPARNQHGLAWHPASGGVIMFGGSGSNAPLGDTWLWNGATWQDLTPSLAASPPPGLGSGLGLDLPGGELLMLDPAQAGTWVWNGSWQNRTTTTVPALPRNSFAAGRDPATFHLLISGHFGATYSAWQWTGTDWQLAAALPANGNRIAVDPVHGQLMVFGDDGHFVLTNAAAGVTPSGSGCGTPPPRIDRSGDRPQLGRTSFGLRLLDAPPAAPVAFAVDLAAAATPLPGGCTLLLANPHTLAFAVANANGHAQVGVPVPLQPALVGLVLHAQGVVIAAPGPYLGMLRLSSGLALTVGF